MPLNVIDHPLAKVIISQLRDKDTDGESFRIAARKITQLLYIEATRNFQLQKVTVTTPLESTDGHIWEKELTIVPIIRAGISMVDTGLELFPNATVGFLGLERDEETAVARNYYCKVPPLGGRKTLVVDPMLATGGSTIQAIEACLEQGADDLDVVTIISCPEGVAAVEERFPKVTIFTATLDRTLNDKKYILPGLGDFGDRLYNT